MRCDCAYTSFSQISGRRNFLLLFYNLKQTKKKKEEDDIFLDFTDQKISVLKKQNIIPPTKRFQSPSSVLDVNIPKINS